MGGAFAVFLKPLVQHGKASFVAFTFTMANLLSVFSSMLLSWAMFLESYHGCFGTFSGTERLSLKLPIRFEDRFCASKKGGIGGGGWVHPGVPCT